MFLDEHENSIENARLTITQPGIWTWIDFPATRHNNGCVLSFADGHAETWRWLEPNTLEISRRKAWIQSVPGVPGKDRDLQRIHAGVPKRPVQ